MLVIGEKEIKIANTVFTYLLEKLLKFDLLKN